MKIRIELDEREQMEISEAVSKKAAAITDAAISKHFKNITTEEFIRILRRALRTSCDSFFQQYMQYYMDKRAPKIFRKIAGDIRNSAHGGRKRK